MIENWIEEELFILLEKFNIIPKNLLSCVSCSIRTLIYFDEDGEILNVYPCGVRVTAIVEYSSTLFTAPSNREK